jgi:bifunctional N-acetylglucosamine-1-phosphate-uridyltransferase/glucosamine-1-phosphate-acetyltransferase GlmU-like protein
MESHIPKVLHKLAGMPMICHILVKLRVLSKLVNLEKIYIVVGQYKNIIQTTIEKYINTVDNIVYIDQPIALGTGHAIQCCRDEIYKYLNTNVLVLSGDVPLLSSNTMFSLIKDNKTATILTTAFDKPDGYGRIIEKDDVFEKIVEHKDCTETQLNIKKANSGIYAFNSNLLYKHLPKISNNNSQQEYYLTDIFEIIKNEENVIIETIELDKEKQYEIQGVNTVNQLNELEELINKKKLII